MNYFLICDILIRGVFILSVQRVLQPASRSKAGVARGLEKTRLPERSDKQQLAGLLGVADYWQLHSGGGTAALCILHFQL